MSTSPPDIIEAGRNVLHTEAEALARMATDLPADFAPVVASILGLPGRVIVSGIGKSGHIARKISATLASTGTPSYFVHPAEASHGDLGMITRHDICLMISNSGEAMEMRDMVAYTRRFSIPLVAISSKPESTLMQAADYRLLLPQAAEACGLGMVPTTSTTLTLALGDALAVAVMRARGFAAEDFHDFHPGGKLGARMMRVGQLMHGGDELPLVTEGTHMSDTLLEMTSKGFGVAAVEDASGKLAGIITDGDLRRNMDGLMGCCAGDVATRAPLTVEPDMLAAQALALMNEGKKTVLIVVDDKNCPVGVLHLHDCLRAGVA